MKTGCLKLEAADGSLRIVQAGQVYKLAPGERLKGVDPTCDGTTAAPQKVRQRLLQELNAELGTGAGDWVKSFAQPIARLLNKQACQGCEVRKVILNAYAKLKAKHGAIEALRLIKDLEIKATTGSHVEALTELRGYLDA